MKFFNYILFAAMALLSLAACKDDDSPKFPETKTYDMTGFAKGADVSWLTEMEKSGIVFYDSLGRQQECMHILRDLGMNSIRLRVWVNPTDGWCNASDVLVKALRAKDLGMRIMIDFHYSDTWADPSSQTKPEAWTDLSFDSLKIAVANHTKNVLNKLKDNNVDVEWVQVGNETSNGMLWDDGKASENMQNYAELTTSGYDAVKEVYPNAKVIVHLDNGYDNSLYRWIFDGLKNNGGKWDVIGMSLYPSYSDYADDPNSAVDDMIDNMNDMISRYNTPVMVCETGMPVDEPAVAESYLTYLLKQCEAVEDSMCLGVFYWEPECSAGWNSYGLGAFDDDGKPTVALDAFK